MKVIFSNRFQGNFQISWWVWGESAGQTWGKCKSNMVASRQSFWILESCGVGCDYTKEVSRWFGNRLYSGHIPSITYCIISHLEAGWPLKSYHPKRRIVFQASFFSYVGYLQKNQAGIPLVDFGCPTAAEVVVLTGGRWTSQLVESVWMKLIFPDDFFSGEKEGKWWNCWEFGTLYSIT